MSDEMRGRMKSKTARAIARDASMEARDCIHRLLEERGELEKSGQSSSADTCMSDKDRAQRVINLAVKLRDMEAQAAQMPQDVAVDSGCIDECERLYYELVAAIEQAAQRQGGEAVGVVGVYEENGVDELYGFVDPELVRPGQKLYISPQPSVPEAPTESMLDEGVTALELGLKRFPDNYTQVVCNIWEDMVSAAPEPPQPQPDWTTCSEAIDILCELRKEYGNATGLHIAASRLLNRIDAVLQRPEPPEDRS